MWDLLVWSDGQSRSPVAVVAKMHYFARLDITQTVKNFAAECMRFWGSVEFRDTLEGSSILALDLDFYVQVLCPADQHQIFKAWGHAWPADVLPTQVTGRLRITGL